MQGQGSEQTPNPTPDSDGEKRAPEDQERANFATKGGETEEPIEIQERKRFIEQLEESRRATEENTRRVNEQARIQLNEYRVGEQGGKFILENFGKKIINFGGILERRTEAAIERRRVYIAQAEAKMAEEKAHYERCKKEFEVKSGELIEFRARMAKLKTRLEEVDDQATKDEIQGYINKYDVLMAPIEDNVARMRHQMEYSNSMTGAYDNQGEAFRAINAKSAAYLQVLRTPFSSLWNRDTRLSIGNLMGDNRVTATRTVHGEHPLGEVDKQKTRGARVEASTSAKTKMGLEREPIQGEVVMEFDTDTYTVTFSRDDESAVVSKNTLFHLYTLSGKARNNQIETVAKSIANDLFAPEDAKQSIKQSLEKVVNQLLPEALEADQNVSQSTRDNISQLRAELRTLTRGIAKKEGADKNALQKEIDKKRSELKTAIDGMAGKVGL